MAGFEYQAIPDCLVDFLPGSVTEVIFNGRRVKSQIKNKLFPSERNIVLQIILWAVQAVVI